MDVIPDMDDLLNELEGRADVSLTTAIAECDNAHIKICMCHEAKSANGNCGEGVGHQKSITDITNHRETDVFDVSRLSVHNTIEKQLSFIDNPVVQIPDSKSSDSSFEPIAILDGIGNQEEQIDVAVIPKEESGIVIVKDKPNSLATVSNEPNDNAGNDMPPSNGFSPVNDSIDTNSMEQLEEVFRPSDECRRNSNQSAPPNEDYLKAEGEDNLSEKYAEMEKYLAQNTAADSTAEEHEVLHEHDASILSDRAIEDEEGNSKYNKNESEQSIDVSNPSEKELDELDNRETENEIESALHILHAVKYVVREEHDNEESVKVDTDAVEAEPNFAARAESNDEAMPQVNTDNTDESTEVAKDMVQRDDNDEGSEDSTAVIDESLKEVEEIRGISVVESMHDITSETDVKHLTESELQLGKVKPLWISDSETTLCMLCCAKFTVFLRRHHCRCCGRVLCAPCTTQKMALPYTNDITKLHRVCDPCFQTLKRIEDYQKDKQQMSVEPSECSTSTEGIRPRVAKSALKTKSTREAGEGDDEQKTVMETATTAPKRSVKFRDGVSPGELPAGAHDENAGSSQGKPKHGPKRHHTSRRLKELRAVEECVSLLPKEKSTDVYTVDSSGTLQTIKREDLGRSLKNHEAIIVAVCRNFFCEAKLCTEGDKTVMCIVSKGMTYVGLDEIFMAYYCEEDIALPFDFMWRIYEIYHSSLASHYESSNEEFGIKPAHLRISRVQRTTLFKNADGPVARDIVLFRPTVQNFGAFLVPSSPFLIAIFIHSCEFLWANVMPQRLLYRIGLQASYYPTPIVSDFSRASVYSTIFETTVLKVFNDFLNWTYSMTNIAGSTVSLKNDETHLRIPRWAEEIIATLISTNKNMLAWSLSFNFEADSHLVCEQDENGSYTTRIFTCGTTSRQVTGASFIIIDGALKGDAESLAVSILEDGIALRLRPDILASLTEALSTGQNFTHESPNMKFVIDWIENDALHGNVGSLLSPIDGCVLTGKYQYGMMKHRVLGSFYPIPTITDWALRLVAVYCIDKSKFAPQMQSKVFSISEQITAQIAYTVVPFVAVLLQKGQRELFLRIRVTNDDAEYTAARWPGLDDEFNAWTELLNNQVAPGLFSVCSYVTTVICAELQMALISLQPLP